MWLFEAFLFAYCIGEVPIFGNRRDDWKLVFKVATGGSSSAYDLFTKSETLNINDEEAQDLTVKSSKHFKSEIINQWDTVEIEQVKVSIYNNGHEKAFFVFDGLGSNRYDWFSHNRLINSSYSDLKSNGQFNYFSVEGHPDVYRRFFINELYKGCPGDSGWLMVLDFNSNRPCSWEQQFLKEPSVLFAPGHRKAIWNNVVMVADSMAVFVKLKSLSCQKLPVCSPPIQLNTDTYCYQACEDKTTIAHSSLQSTTEISTHDDQSETTASASKDLQDKIENLKKELSVDRRKTNRYRRTLTCASDDRHSSRTMGLIGGVIIGLVVTFIVLLDSVGICKGRTCACNNKTSPDMSESDR